MILDDMCHFTLSALEWAAYPVYIRVVLVVQGSYTSGKPGEVMEF